MSDIAAALAEYKAWDGDDGQGFAELIEIVSERMIPALEAAQIRIERLEEQLNAVADGVIGDRARLSAENARLQALLVQAMPLLRHSTRADIAQDQWELRQRIAAALQGQMQECTEHRWALLQTDVDRDGGDWTAYLNAPRFCANPGCTAKASDGVGGGS